MSSWFAQRQRIASIPLDDRGAQYGDGVFETIAIRNGEPRFWSLHCDRLMEGCNRLGITSPESDSIWQDLQYAISAGGVDTDYALAKIVVSAGSSARGYGRPESISPAIRIGVFAADRLDASTYRDGVAVILCDTRLAIQPQLAGIKSLNRIEQVLARAEWNESTITEGLMLDTDERLICGTMSNVFISHGNVISTPAITRCGVAGVMREHLLSVFDNEGVDCSIRDIVLPELASADELILCNSQFGVLPVRKIDERTVVVDSVSRTIMRLAADHGVSECDV